MADEVAGAAIALGRIEPAIIYGALDRNRKIRHDAFRVDMMNSADRADRTRQQGANRAAPLVGIARLGMDIGILRAFREDFGSQLPAGIAIDTGLINEKLAFDILRHFSFRVSHRRSW